MLSQGSAVITFSLQTEEYLTHRFVRVSNHVYFRRSFSHTPTIRGVKPQVAASPLVSVLDNSFLFYVLVAQIHSQPQISLSPHLCSVLHLIQNCTFLKRLLTWDNTEFLLLQNIKNYVNSVLMVTSQLALKAKNLRCLRMFCLTIALISRAIC